MHTRLSLCLVWMSGALALAACGGKEAPPADSAASTAPAATAAATTPGSWTPEALEELRTTGTSGGGRRCPRRLPDVGAARQEIVLETMAEYPLSTPAESYEVATK